MFVITTLIIMPLRKEDFAAFSGVPRGGVWGVQTPHEIPKISVESSIA